MREAERVAERLALRPDPVAGWFAESSHDGTTRAYRQLIAAGAELPWHAAPALARWRHLDGAPGVLSFVLPDGRVGAAQARPGGPSVTVEEGTRLVVDSAGVWTLFEVAYAPAVRLTDRAFAPDDWHPPADSPLVGTPLA